MPIFEYHCAKCDKDFEVLVLGNQKITCPRCNGKKVEKLLSAVSFKSEGEYSSSKGSTAACGTCTATSCKTCGH
jgi:putative FmdB family regulatory protein